MCSFNIEGHPAQRDKLKLKENRAKRTPLEKKIQKTKDN